MSEKIITVLSNASLDHYPENKISNFRNRLYSPISLTDGEYEIAILSCSYNASTVIVAENEEIGKYFNPDSETEEVLKAPFAMTSFEQLLVYIRDVTHHKFEINDFGFVTYLHPGPKYRHFTPSERVANILGITAVRCENKLIDTNKPKYSKVGLETPYQSPIHYGLNDILYWLPLKDGETKATEVIAKKVTTFDELMKEFPRNTDEKTEKIEENKWMVTMRSNDRVKFNNCKETELIRHKQGTLTITVEHCNPDLFFKKGDLVGYNLLGERVLCSRDILSYMDIVHEFQRVRPDFIAYFNIHNRFSFTLSTEHVGDDRNFLKGISFTAKLVRNLGMLTVSTNTFNLGDMKTYTGAYRPVSNLGTSQLLVYCDLIHPQHIGNTVAPLLRSIKTEYDGAEHVFPSPLYFPIARDYVDVIHMYIMCENGEPPPFELGTFTATLSIRKSSLR